MKRILSSDMDAELKKLEETIETATQHLKLKVERVVNTLESLTATQRSDEETDGICFNTNTLKKHNIQ